MTVSAHQQKKKLPWPNRMSTLVLVSVTVVGSFLALVMPFSTRPSVITATAGQVSPQDVLAPQAAEFVSEVFTEQQRKDAEISTAPVFSSPDSSIAREQLDALRGALLFITQVRQDQFSTLEQKQSDLASLNGLEISAPTAESLLTLSSQRWELIQQESLSVLEQVMRAAIRQSELESVRGNVSALVSLNLTEEQAHLAAMLAAGFVAPNVFFSSELTEQAQLAAREAVSPVVRSFVAGETVVQRGEVLSEADIEALRNLGLIQPDVRLEDYVGAVSAVGILTVLVFLYVIRRGLQVFNTPRNLLLVSILFLVFLVAARLLIPNRTIIPYAFPLPAFGLLVSILIGSEAGMVLSLVLSFLAAYGLPNSLDLSVYYLVTSWCGLLVLGPARRLGVFFRSGIAIALAGIAILVAFRIPFNSWDWVGVLTLAGAAGVSGLASAGITLLLQHSLAQQLGLATALQLLEIARPDFPLSQFFLRNAPGTYQHSLQVSNLAEQAAEAIGVDTLLVRVGALYHDCGKALNPSFFIENQPQGSINTHDDMPPQEAATIIIRHVADGVVLAKKYQLPERIQDFILEHHGTLATRYQYNRAVERAGGDLSKVSLDDFRYPGPAPRSRETAILMFADGVEARARAERPKTEEELRVLINKVMETCQHEGQLIDTRLTLRDLHLISEAFVSALRGVYHPRIEYPKLVQNITQEEENAP